MAAFDAVYAATTPAPTLAAAPPAAPATTIPTSASALPASASSIAPTSAFAATPARAPPLAPATGISGPASASSLASTSAAFAPGDPHHPEMVKAFAVIEHWCDTQIANDAANTAAYRAASYANATASASTSAPTFGPALAAAVAPAPASTSTPDVLDTIFYAARLAYPLPADQYQWRPPHNPPPPTPASASASVTPAPAPAPADTDLLDDATYYTIQPPAPHRRVVPARPYPASGPWYSIPASSIARTPMIGRSVSDWATFATGTPSQGFGIRVTSYTKAFGHILLHYATHAVPNTLCLNCFTHHLPHPCRLPPQDHSPHLLESHPDCPRCHRVHPPPVPCPSTSGPPPPPPPPRPHPTPTAASATSATHAADFYSRQASFASP